MVRRRPRRLCCRLDHRDIHPLRGLVRRRLAVAWAYVRPRVRWRDVFLIALIAASMLFTVNYVHDTNRDFCGVVNAATATPVERPSDPAANPSREQAWEWYQRFMDLGRSLGC